MPRMIFDKDATQVFVQDGTNCSDCIATPKNQTRRIASKAVRMSVADYVENLASYSMPNFRPMSLQDGEAGECVFCGCVTSSTHRKLCGTCMESEHKKLYENVQKALQNHEDYIKL